MKKLLAASIGAVLATSSLIYNPSPAYAATPASYISTEFSMTESIQSADILVILVPEDFDDLRLNDWDRASRNHISRAIDVADFKTGVYFVTVISQTGKKTRKLVVQ